ncbi:MAG: winged helix-turn-helix transcriptional regulator, partial [Acidimicrobiia bacterium]
PVLIALYVWGSKYCPPEALNVRLVDRESGGDVDPLLIDRSTGHPIDDEHTTFLAGPAADDRLRAVIDRKSGLTSSAEIPE